MKAFGSVATWFARLAVLTAILAGAGVLLNPGNAASPTGETCLACDAGR